MLKVRLGRLVIVVTVVKVDSLELGMVTVDSLDLDKGRATSGGPTMS
jgi:hypothetical protein